jgi:Ricin-type beta-trefoil lectin domain
MLKSPRLVVPLAVTALVAAGGIGLGLALTANAQTTITSCSGEGTTSISCEITPSASVDTDVSNPSTIQALVTLSNTSTTSTPTDLYIQLTYSIDCFDSNGDEQASTQPASPENEYQITSTVTEDLTLGYTDPASCELESLTGTLETSTNDSTFTPITTDGSFTMTLQWTPQTTTTATATTTTSSSVDVSYINGYDGKCLDDKGNFSNRGTKVIIWGCNHGDSAQGWSFSSDELKHNGKCANIQGGGGSGSKLILWSCTGASNEKWSHSSSGEYVSAETGHGLLCIDDPAYSKSNGTQLIVYTCHNSSNQHWAS